MNGMMECGGMMLFGALGIVVLVLLRVFPRVEPEDGGQLLPLPPALRHGDRGLEGDAVHAVDVVAEAPGVGDVRVVVHVLGELPLDEGLLLRGGVEVHEDLELDAVLPALGGVVDASDPVAYAGAAG